MNMMNFRALLEAQKNSGAEAYMQEAAAIRAIAGKRPNPKGLSPQRYFFTSLVYGFSSCWYWGRSVDDAGYGVARGLDGKPQKAHRFSWELHYGPIPPDKNVLHSCDVRCCTNPEHIFLGTQLENVRDCIRKGRFRIGGGMRGEESALAKLTEKDVMEMRALRASGLYFYEIAEKFGVSKMTAYRAATGRSWAHLEDPNGRRKHSSN